VRNTTASMSRRTQVNGACTMYTEGGGSPHTTTSKIKPPARDTLAGAARAGPPGPAWPTPMPGAGLAGTGKTSNV
jgi:hypothetical protein